MKITLEPTTQPYSTISVKVLDDDLDIYDMWDKLIKPALLAFGYPEKTINKLNEPNTNSN